MTKLVNPNMFNAVKHGVSSRHGLLPWENPDDYASLQAQWRRELRPHGAILEDLFAGIVRNRWLRQRNVQAVALFVACDPFGRAVQRRSDGSWSDTADKLLGHVNERLQKLAAAAEALEKRAANGSHDVAESKQLTRSAAKLSDTVQTCASCYESAMAFFVGLGDEIEKQADRDIELDAKFNKQLANFSILNSASLRAPNFCPNAR